MKHQTFKHQGRVFTVTLHCEGNDCAYPRITDRVIRVLDGETELGRSFAGTHQGYDANRNCSFRASDLDVAKRIIAK